MKISIILAFIIIPFITSCGGGGSSANNPGITPPVRDFTNLKIIAPPSAGMYVGQYEWASGDINTFEQAIGKKAALWSRQWPMDNFDEITGQPVFPVAEANQAWNNGQVVLANGFDINVGPGNPFADFTIDKLLNGDFNAQLDALAEQLRAFGKPVIFMAGREPNGILSEYFGGFGADGDKSFSWAVQNQAGFAEFDPSVFPNPELYTDLADPTVCDGVERLAAAQRYYHHYLVDVKGLKFLTFEGMGWATTTVDEILTQAIDNGAGTHEQTLIQSCYDYRNFYPGNDYVDWVSLNFYTVDFFKDAWPQFNLPFDILISTQTYLDRLSTIMQKVREVAPGKPVLFTELGFPDGTNTDSARAAERVTTSMNAFLSDFPEINAFAFWSSIPIPETFDPTSPLYWPFDSLLRPNTQQGDAMKAIIDGNPSKFHSCAYLSDGKIMPNCTP